MSKVKKCKHTILKKDCDSCKELQKEWDKKLIDSGFDDHSDGEWLKDWSSIFHKRHTLEQVQAKVSYYLMAGHFLNDYPFDKELVVEGNLKVNPKMQEAIWTYHSEGIELLDITDTLRKAGFKTNRTTISRAIRALRSKMFNMYMSPKGEYHE